MLANIRIQKRTTASVFVGALIYIGTANVDAASLSYFNAGITESATRGLYDFDLDSKESLFRASLDETGQREAFCTGCPGKFFFQGPSFNSIDKRESDGVVFGIEGHSFTHNSLYSINPTSGDFHAVGHPGSDRIYTSISFHPQTEELFGLTFEDSGRRALVRIDVAAGTFTEIAKMEFSGVGSTAIEYLDDGRLYVAFKNDIYSVSPINGAAVHIGNTGQPIDHTPNDFAELNGSLYAGTFRGRLLEIDLLSGNAEVIGELVDDNWNSGLFVTNAPISTIPIPSMLVPFLYAFCVIASRMNQVKKEISPNKRKNKSPAAMGGVFMRPFS